MALVWEVNEVKLGRTMRAAEAVVGDETGNIRVVWFNQPYLAWVIKPNTQLVLSGRVGLYRNRLVLESPEYESVEGQEDFIHTGRLVPVYPLTEGLRPRPPSCYNATLSRSSPRHCGRRTTPTARKHVSMPSDGSPLMNCC